jgi:large subunit ribosomal protein L25
VSDTINVSARDETGTLRMRRLRKQGQIPAVLYGHGEGTVKLSVSESDLNRAIQHGSHIVTLAGQCNENALIKDVQWDAFGVNILHLDLTRVSATEEVEVTLPIELKGEAPGTHEGGVVKFMKHEVTILCPANKLPDKIELKINNLELDQVISAGDVPLPDSAKLACDPDEPIVGCSMPTEVSEETEAVEEGAEPEVIGAKEEENEEDND